MSSEPARVTRSGVGDRRPDSAPTVGIGHTPDRRIAFVDNARAIGILLVVVGHAPSLPGAASDFIFAFHMPLFFLLSGLVVAPDRLRGPARSRAALLARTLLLPYLAYFLVSWAYWLVFKRHGLQSATYAQTPWWDPLVGFVRGNGEGLYFNVVLWFFPCLFVVALSHHLASRFLKPWPMAIVASATAFVFVTLHDSQARRWVWSADCAIVGLAFYAIGVALNPHVRHPSISARRIPLLAAAVLGYVLCEAIAARTGHVDLNSLRFGSMPALYLPMGAIGIVATLALSAILPASPIARWLSTNTVVVFPLHFLFFSLVTGVALVVFDRPDFKDGTLFVTGFYALAALLLSWPASILVQRIRRGVRKLATTTD